ncbi:MAG: M66 family metalloprotease [Gemmatimonadetes bacterium]|nr:M66 family metalloprotease [Gemmatimonadota bacterium]
MDRHTKRTLAARGFLLLAPALAGCGDLVMEAGAVPSDLQIIPVDTMMTIGDEAVFSVSVVDQNRRLIDKPPSWAQPVWSSENQRIVHVLPNGAAEAVRFGETTLSVSYAGLTGHTRVRANPARVGLSVEGYYFTQGVQNSSGDVPLIAGRPALLRVFVTGDRDSYYQPVVEASFYRNSTLVRTFVMTPETEVLPSEVDEGRLDWSYDAVVPASLMQSGTEMAIEVDTERTVPVEAGGRRPRVPEQGWIPIEVQAVPRFDLTVVPVVTASPNGPAVHDWTDGMTPEGEQLRYARAVLPISEMTVTVHEGFMTSVDLTTATGWAKLLGEVTFLRVTEGERGYYYGAVSLDAETTSRGLGFIGHPVSVGRANPETLAHELGHNLGLHHAPCGGAIAPDRSFPYMGGSIGVWGYDFHGERLVSASLYRDIMGYCSPSWVSDYHFIKAMDFRLTEEEALVSGSVAAMGPEFVGSSTAPMASTASRTLLLWGRTGPGELALDPAFMVDLPVTLPASEGPYRLEGFGPAGEQRFGFGFEPRPVATGGGTFLFAVPYDVALEGELGQVVLSGPEGRVTLEPFGSTPMAIVTERSSGRVRAIVRGWTGGELRGLDLAPGDAEIRVSEGLPR